MKKLLRPFVQIFAIGVVFFLSNCSKGGGVGPLNCSANATKMSEALTDYANSNGDKGKCEAYRKAVRDFVKSCPTFYSVSQRKDLEDSIQDMCND